MAGTNFIHGVEWFMAPTSGVRPINVARSGVIGLIGTAGKGTPNRPVLILGNREEAISNFGAVQEDGFTIPRALNLIFAQTGAVVVVVNVCDPSVHNTAVTQEVKQFNDANKLKTGKPYISSVVLANDIKAVLPLTGNTITLPATITGVTQVKSADGQTLYAEGTDYTVALNVVTRKTTGTIPAGASLEVTYTANLLQDVDYTVNLETGEIVRTTSSQVVKNGTIKVTYNYVDPTKVTNTDVLGTIIDEQATGALALLDADNEFGVKPKVIIAPTFTHQKLNATTSNAVVSGLLPIAEKLKGKIYADAPNGTKEDAYQYRQDWGSKRIEVCYPFQKIEDTEGNIIEFPLSVFVAGLNAKIATEQGFWVSCSNQVINGTLGNSKSVSYSIDNPEGTVANYLNENQISTVIRESGFRYFGNRTTSPDPLFAFAVHVQVDDIIAESIARAHFYAVDANITKNLVDAVQTDVNAFLRSLVTKNAILGGKAIISPEKNPVADLQSGKLRVDYEYTRVPLNERMTFVATVVDTYLSEIFGQ